ncbi:hypothetical protein Ddye_023694 [Dipteronia dyeriana]|uniref:BED-type domain-containing protein n=1 Tax=Dipteronia dyeriana TaxID=168575 RepID=A0AAD9TU25_9ROSI|nr:hypothetical protein Ddye_023694 [Dipteronia dyeriana]
MDPNQQIYFPDGLNMLNDEFDILEPTRTQAGPSGFAVTPTSRPRKLTSDMWQCFNKVQMTLPNGKSGPRAKCKFCHKDYATSTRGTGHLRRHMYKCMPAHGQVIHQIVEMSELLNNYRKDEHLGPAVVAMETKLKKYWANISLLYALSVIVDPRVKLSGLEVLLEFIGINLSIDYSEQITDIRTKLFKIFHIYKSRYLEAQFDAVEDNEEFDLLLWWKTYMYRYPILSHLSSDVLVIPVSTVSSEQAFSTSGRIIEPRRSCLSPEMVNVLTCLRDWEHAKKRLQNLTVDKELILNFDNLFIDDPAGSGHGQN